MILGFYAFYGDYKVIFVCKQCGGLCRYLFTGWNRIRESESVFVVKQVLSRSRESWRCCRCVHSNFCKYCEKRVLTN